MDRLDSGVGCLDREQFLLDPSIGHLNHGAYGATPLPVLECQWDWQRRMESRPVEFHARHLEGYMREARQPIAAYLGASLDSTAFVENSTTAINWIGRSLPWQAGDEVLLNTHEYGAVWRCWQVLAEEYGLKLRMLEVAGAHDLLEVLEREAGPRTRAVVVSHLTSATAQLFDIEAVGRWARARDIFSIVDGAHAPGHIPLALDLCECDFYVGNLHKWLWAPKGAALLWVRPECQRLIKPVIVSWGYDSPVPLVEPQWVAWLQMQATRDPSPFLAAPAGLEYQQQVHEPVWESHCCRRLELLSQALLELGALLLPWSRPLKMRAFEWPSQRDPVELQRLLLDAHRLEVPFYRWEGRLMFRVSLQHYVSDGEIQRLLEGLSEARVAPRSD